MKKVTTIFFTLFLLFSTNAKAASYQEAYKDIVPDQDALILEQVSADQMVRNYLSATNQLFFEADTLLKQKKQEETEMLILLARVNQLINIGVSTTKYRSQLESVMIQLFLLRSDLEQRGEILELR